VLTVPGVQSTDEDTTLTFASLSATRSRSPIPTRAQARSTWTSPSPTEASPSARPRARLEHRHGTGTVALSGTVSAINTALSGLDYDPDSNYHGADTLDVDVDDAGHDGTGGARSDSETVAISVDSVNDLPVNTVPGAQTLDEDTTRELDLSVADPDAGDLGITISVLHGTLTLAGRAASRTWPATAPAR
jgi:hypothetical protein